MNTKRTISLAVEITLLCRVCTTWTQTREHTRTDEIENAKRTHVTSETDSISFRQEISQKKKRKPLQSEGDEL